MSTEKNPSFTPTLHSYEPLAFQDEVFKYINIAAIVASASAGGTLIGSYPELTSSSVEVQEDPALAKPKKEPRLMKNSIAGWTAGVGLRNQCLTTVALKLGNSSD